MLDQLLLLALLHVPIQGNTAIYFPSGVEIQDGEREGIKIEADLQTKFPGLIQRKGNKLFIRSTSGQEHVFKDNPNTDQADTYVTHRAATSLPGLDWVIVQSGYYEGGGQELISLSSGAMLQFDGFQDPILSPDRKRLLIYSQDMVAGYSSNYISIYQIDQNQMQLEIELSGDPDEQHKDAWGPSNPRWINDSTVAFDEDRYVNNDSMQATHITLKLINGKWQKKITGKSAVVKNH